MHLLAIYLPPARWKLSHGLLSNKVVTIEDSHHTTLWLYTTCIACGTLHVAILTIHSERYAFVQKYELWDTERPQFSLSIIQANWMKSEVDSLWKVYQVSIFMYFIIPFLCLHLANVSVLTYV